MDPFTLAATAGTALVAALATDAWQSVRSAVAGVWSRHHVVGADDVEDTLDRTREGVLAARRDGSAEDEAQLVNAWRMQFAALLTAHPELATELQRLLNDQINPVLSVDERAKAQNIKIEVKVSDTGKANVLGSGTQINN